MKKIIFLFILLTLLSIIARAQKISGWRPENLTGVLAETGLLKSWPADGPKLFMNSKPAWQTVIGRAWTALARGVLLTGSF